MATDDHVVGDVEVLRARPLGLHRTSDVVDPAVLQSESTGAGDALQAKQKRDVGIPDRDAFEVVVVGGHQVEEVVVAGAVEDHFAVTRRLDHDRLVRRPARRQVVGAVDRRVQGQEARMRHAVHVVESIGDVETRVDQDDVPGLDSWREHILVIGMPLPHEVGVAETGEGGFLLRSFPADGIDMIGMAASRRLRLLSRANRRRFLSRAAHAIWIREDETAFVLGVWLQIQNAPGKHVAGIEMPGVRSDTVGIRRGGFDGNEGVAAAIHLLMLEAEERKARVPRLLAFPPVGDGDLSIAVVVARNLPLEAQRHQRRRLDDEFTRPGRRL